MKNPLNIRLLVAAARNLGTRGAILGVLALTAPLGAFTAATALSGSGPLSAPAAFVSAVATDVGLATSTADQPTPFSNTTVAGNAPMLGSPVGGSSRSALTASDISPTTSPTADATGTASATAVGPHSNGHGCDDIIHAAGATPAAGGPVGCTVGNSGDHRQNGKQQATATPTASAAAGTSPTASAGNDDKDDKDDDSSSQGCVTATPVAGTTTAAGTGSTGCKSGKGDDKDEHGKGRGTATPVPSGTAAAAPVAGGSSSSSGNGNGNSHGNNSGHGNGGGSGHGGGNKKD